MQVPGVAALGPLPGAVRADGSEAALAATLLYMAARRGGGKGRLLRLGQLKGLGVPQVNVHLLRHALPAAAPWALHDHHAATIGMHCDRQLSWRCSAPAVVAPRMPRVRRSCSTCAVQGPCLWHGSNKDVCRALAPDASMHGGAGGAAGTEGEAGGPARPRGPSGRVICAPDVKCRRRCLSMMNACPVLMSSCAVANLPCLCVSCHVILPMTYAACTQHHQRRKGPVLFQER